MPRDGARELEEVDREFDLRDTHCPDQRELRLVNREPGLRDSGSGEARDDVDVGFRDRGLLVDGTDETPAVHFEERG